MLDRVLSRQELLERVDALARSHRIVGPVEREGRFFYESVEEAHRLALDFNYTVFSPKAVLLPPKETLFVFNRGNGSFETKPVYDDSRVALVGVHPCDVNSVRLLDRVFASINLDEHYLRRRRSLFVIAIDCPRPCTEGVFCHDMKANGADDGFDIMCYPLVDEAGGETRYGVVFGSSAGREFILYAQAGQPALVADERTFERYQRDKESAFPRMIPYDVEALPGLFDRSYDSLLWEATARRCYSCGSCNMACPTCYCFDVTDDMDLGGESGRRVREWDGCQLRGFAEVAGGHNFRSKTASRLRHRMYRKAKWVNERENIPGCVGCARCDRACTAKISSVEIYRQLAEEGSA